MRRISVYRRNITPAVLFVHEKVKFGCEGVDVGGVRGRFIDVGQGLFNGSLPYEESNSYLCEISYVIITYS